MAADIQKGSGMSGLIYCSYKRAAKPYYLEIAGRNIYSIEELCYFLQDNIYLLDENIMTSEFCDWLEKELDAGNCFEPVCRPAAVGVRRQGRRRQEWRRKQERYQLPRLLWG